MKRTKKRKQCNESTRQNGAKQRKKSGQGMELKQLETMEYLLKENRRLRGRLFDVQDNLNKLKDNSQSLTDLIHISWEGIRTESVCYDEIKNAVTSLYLLSDNITKHAKHIVKETAL